MAVRKIDPEKCIGCRSCENSCPSDVFRYDAVMKKVFVKYPQECRLCLWCITLCPSDAIDLTRDKDFPVFTCWG